MHFPAPLLWSYPALGPEDRGTGFFTSKQLSTLREGISFLSTYVGTGIGYNIQVSRISYPAIYCWFDFRR